MSKAIALFLLLAWPFLAQERSPYVYLIRVSKCGDSDSVRTLTGFRVRGKSGIVTALHGVAGCKNLAAISEKGTALKEDLVVDSADINRDTALLLSNELKGLPAEGLEPAATIPQAGLRVEGHPLGIKDLGSSIKLHYPAVGPLEDSVRRQFRLSMVPASCPNPCHLTRRSILFLIADFVRDKQGLGAPVSCGPSARTFVTGSC
jgi:hypothetical protein